MKLPQRNGRMGSNCSKFSVRGIDYEANGIYPGGQSRNQGCRMLWALRPWAGGIKHKAERIYPSIDSKIHVFWAF
jgi:hypothetical protein